MSGGKRNVISWEITVYDVRGGNRIAKEITEYYIQKIMEGDIRGEK